MLCCKLVCFCTCLIVHISVQNNLSAVALGTLYFDERCGRRHHNDSLCTVAFCRIRNALCMVSCRCGYQTLISLLFGKGTDLIIGTTDLVSAGHLHIFRF